MYGMPQPASYGQYAGYNGYAGFPGQGGAGSPGTASPGMPQAAIGTGALGLSGAQQTDPSSAAGQAQWGADPSSYYSNYWASTCFDNDL